MATHDEVRVFSQLPSLVSALPQLLGHARRFFHAEVEVLEASAPGLAAVELESVRLRFESRRHGGKGVFRIDARPTSDDDRHAAEVAEARGRAGGMSLLAGRCPSVWWVTPEASADAIGELELCGLLASIALGPVLPADESTLYGVRGAIERAEQLARSTSSTSSERAPSSGAD